MINESYSTLASAILKTAIVDGDVNFFDTDWASDLIELVNYKTPVSCSKLKSLALNNRKEKMEKRKNIFEM